MCHLVSACFPPASRLGTPRIAFPGLGVDFTVLWLEYGALRHSSGCSKDTGLGDYETLVFGVWGLDLQFKSGGGPVIRFIGFRGKSKEERDRHLRYFL